MKLKLLLSILFCLALATGQSQDIHLSHIYASPFLLNPATTGVFNGTSRLIANYRSQWRSVTADYRTFMFSGDSNFLELGKHQSIGLGGHFYADVAGDLDFTTNFAGFSIASIRSFDKKGSHILSLGIQVGRIGSFFDPNKIIAHDLEFFDNGTSQLSMLDISTGILWYKKIAKDQFIFLGGSIYHVNEPIYSFIDKENVSEQLYRRFVFHGGSNLSLTKQVTVVPSFIYMKQGPYQQFTAGTFLRYDTWSRGKTTPSAFMLGGWIRALNQDRRLGLDAFIATLRMELRSYLFTFSYDVNISSLARASFGRGGPEISFVYIFGKPVIGSNGVVKDPRRKRKHKIECPYF